MKSITAVLSMLHEPLGRPNCATRLFRNEPVLAWTLHRLSDAHHIDEVAVLCWEDQLPDVEPIAQELQAYVSVRCPRVAHPQIESVAAARRWADGWRGGLLGTCEFDRGFYAHWITEILEKMGGDAVALVDPSAALVDPVLVDRLIEHARGGKEIEMCFSQAAPGLSTTLLTRTILQQLSAANTHPGTLLCYTPDLPRRDPISGESCAPVSAPIARTTQRFTLDSERQIQRISSATVHLNGQLISTEAEHLLYAIQNAPPTTDLPRELVLELNTRRATRPIFQPVSHLEIERPNLSLDDASHLIRELAQADDARLTFGGAGDPLLHPNILDIIDVANDAGIAAISIETDLVGVDSETILGLASSQVDIISVHIPATTQRTYEAVMGVDAIREVLENLNVLVNRRQELNRGTPLVVPLFVKCAANLGEMERWYDHWLKLLQSAVISGPGDYSRQIPNTAVVTMAPPRRRPCARISSRLAVLSDGQCVACEQDVLARQRFGNIGSQPLTEIWKSLNVLRKDHQEGNWNNHKLCASCTDWHRP